MIKNKIIVILGPTSSGKTKLAVKMAARFSGEIVSADSRQVYRGMDIGTGKDLNEYKVRSPLRGGVIRCHLIDVANPRKRFNLAEYQKLAFAAIADILQRGKLPILVGGSGLYLQAIVDNYQLVNSAANLKLRKKLEKFTVSQLFNKIKKLAPKMADKINNSDKNNKRRLIRYLEILTADQSFKAGTGKQKYQTLIIGLSPTKQVLRKRIYNRLIARLEKEKMTAEVKKLHQQGLSWQKLEAFGLEYKYVSLYLQKKLDYKEMLVELNLAINKFARRQMAWFRRWERQGKKINWATDSKKIEKLASWFLK